MKRRFGILFCLLALAGAWLLWPRGAAPSPKPVVQAAVPAVAANAVTATNHAVSVAKRTNHFAFRLANTPKTIGQLASDRHAILLANAFIESDLKTDLSIPPHLRASGEPGAFIVQARGVTGAAFRAALTGAGGQIVSYIPNNAYLVQLTSAGASALAGNPLVQTVLPYEPYYKISMASLVDTKEKTAAITSAQNSQTPQPSLLELAVNQQPLPAGTFLTLGLYGSSAAATEAQVQALGGKIVGRDRSPFGPIVRVQPPADWLALAQLPGVQIVEPVYQRKSANDLSRVTVGVSPDTTTPAPAGNYLHLTGQNVLVAVNDTGIDAAHPDFSSGRVLSDPDPLGNINSIDTDGHGTHVAGIIVGDGTESGTVTSALGSTNGANFRGKAPAARLYSVNYYESDQYLQEAAARTNALLSNNSWNYYGDNLYDLAAASYDAAVRDAVPEVTGPQPVLFVFSAGNSGGGNNYGVGGSSDSIVSPATAKNVITVGALEQLRNITTNGYQEATDSSGQVAWYSSCGNVGVGTEGTYGRFKPDVVAPGSFTVSTRSSQWAITNDPLASLNSQLGSFYRYESGTSMAAADVTGVLALMQDFFTNQLSLTPSPALLKAMLINGARSAWPGQYGYAFNGDVNEEGWGLINLSNSLPASLASSSTTTPLFFADQSLTNALATGDSRTYTVTVSANSQALPLRITLAWTDPPGNPAAALKLVNNLNLIVTNLATGQVYYGNTFAASVPPYSIAYTTNDAAPVLDSVNNVQNIVIAPTLGASYAVTVVGHSVNVNAVTAEQTGIVQDYALVVACDDAGNTGGVAVTGPVAASSSSPQVTGVTGTNQISFYQVIGANAPLLSTNFISFGTNSGYAANAVLYLGQTNQWHFYVATNTTSFTNAAFVVFNPSTLALPREGVFAGWNANSTRPEADLDMYVAGPNDPNAFGLTNLDQTVIANCINQANGDSAMLGRGGVAYVAFTNSMAGQIYYIGIKCEDQTGGQYGFIGAFSQNPFSSMDTNGNEYVNAFNVPVAIPDGNNAHPGVGYALGLALQPIQVRNVIVTNTFDSQNFGDLPVFLSHNEEYATLNNHNSLGPVTNQMIIYDDSLFIGLTNSVTNSITNSLPGPFPSAGPGTLRNFVASDGSGLWVMTAIDDGQAQASTVDNFQLKIEPHQAGNGLLQTVRVPAGGWHYDYIIVPVGCTNLLVVGTNLPPTAVPSIKMALQFNTPPTLTSNLRIVDLDQGSPFPGNSISYGPPLTPGIYFVGFYNPSGTDADVEWGYSLAFSASAVTTVDYASTDTPLPILDDAVTVSPQAMTNYFTTNSTIFVSDLDVIQGINVGLRVDHPRISDLSFTLIDPYGDRYLLMENRGGDSTNGCGLTVIVTNVFIPVSSSGSYQPDTNVINVGITSGTYPITYNFYTVPDEMTVYYGSNNIAATNLIWDSGMVGNQAAPITHWVSFPPPGVPTNSTYLTIIMNEFGNPASTNGAGFDLWDYTLGGNYTNYEYLTFTEDTNLTTTPIKFAPLPFVPALTSPPSNLYYQAEQSLAPLVGNYAFGPWQLEVLDNRAGATNPAPMLVSWQLEFKYANTNFIATTYPILSGFQSQTNTITANSIQWYQVNVPITPIPANFATNILDSASAPVNLWYSVNYPPSLDTLLLANSTNGIGLPILSTNSTPVLVPGNSYYLGVENTNNIGVTSVVEVDFDHGNQPPGPASVHFNSATVTTSSTQLSWSPAAGSHYQIQWKDSLTSAWNTITDPATTTSNGVSIFTDNGAQTAPRGTQRFYRLVWVP